MKPRIDYEFYETPESSTLFLFREMLALGCAIRGTVFEPCVGSGAIPRAYARLAMADPNLTRALAPWRPSAWRTNDLDPRWFAQTHEDATTMEWPDVDFTVTNPPFSLAYPIWERAWAASRLGVVMHLRGSIHEPLKTGPRRNWLRQTPPTGTLWLPRFSHQRNSKGEWATDSVTCCWVVWLKDAKSQFIRYADEQLQRDLVAETPAYRQRMDDLMGWRAA